MPLTEGFPWDDLRKIFHGCQRMAKLPNGVETLRKISTGWVGCTSVTDDRRMGDSIQRTWTWVHFAKNFGTDCHMEWRTYEGILGNFKRFAEGWVWMCRLKVIHVIGKRSRPVPILLTQEMYNSTMTLNNMRDDCGILQENRYVFALPASPTSRLNFYKVLQKVAQQAQMNKPTNLTTTRLRKHLATVAQACFTCSSLLDISCIILHWMQSLSPLYSQKCHSTPFGPVTLWTDNNLIWSITCGIEMLCWMTVVVYSICHMTKYKLLWWLVNTVQNVVDITALLLIIRKFEYFLCLA